MQFWGEFRWSDNHSQLRLIRRYRCIVERCRIACSHNGTHPFWLKEKHRTLTTRWCGFLFRLNKKRCCRKRFASALSFLAGIEEHISTKHTKEHTVSFLYYVCCWMLRDAWMRFHLVRWNSSATRVAESVNVDGIHCHPGNEALTSFRWFLSKQAMLMLCILSS